ncbi:type VI secretion protein [Robbsia andropogonis]|uniref:Type VI secretion protein n=1 Tax=Robbsia andropogonis TaxID=28092 RepID=A0A0F5K4K5_9BURK|nr:type VI secretion system contractile sheath small subunit [Robbsia andropogonis]KKB64880.1 type VI secretion protein [Robbsia andropogonis]MCP1119133.1 type VI secretion system contractile sheath small subunit [Robbsia andropogonis]MCP1129016.1 type VI secretion system contractile sheath small subunit [Robbsia andropogonis]
MSDSLQNWVGRNRPPRVQITYDVEVGDAVEKRELPMVVGIMADLSGHPINPLPKLKDRRLVEIDRDNFSDVMGQIKPRLKLSVPNTLSGDGTLPISLSFSTMADFHPDNLVRQIAPLAKLLEARQQLRDLLAKLDGNDELDAMLEQIVQDTTELEQLKQEAGAVSDADAGAPTNKVDPTGDAFAPATPEPTAGDPS